MPIFKPDESKLRGLLSQELIDFCKSIAAYPPNIVEFNKLGLVWNGEGDEFLDPITYRVMNIPVTLQKKNFDFATLDLLPEVDGIKLNPYTKCPFFMHEVQPNAALYSKIRQVITDELERRKNIIKQICKAAKDGNIDDMHALFKANPNIKINDDLSYGYTPLHYACKHGQIASALELVKNGADLGLPSTDECKVTAFELLRRQDVTKADLLRNRVLEFLTVDIANNLGSSYLQYAKLLLHGIVDGRGNNIQLGLNYLRQAGEHDVEDGCLLLGDIYTNGLYGVNGDMVKAYFAYLQAAKKYQSKIATIKCFAIKHVLDKEEFSAAIARGDGLTDDFVPPLSSEEVAEAAMNFNADAQFLYALMSRKSAYISQNILQYIKYLIYAVKACCIPAILHYYSNVDDVTQVNTVADQQLTKETILQGLDNVYCLKLIADYGKAQAQYLYASLCFQGTCVTRDLPTAAMYCKRAADNGYVEAQHNYAVFCHKGDCGTIDLPTAARYYKLAASNDHPTAMFAYSLFCYQGAGGVTRDLPTAAIYCKRAADKGHVQAEYQYALFCFKGDCGITQDLLTAACYFQRAAGKGHVEAQRGYDICQEIIRSMNGPQSTARGLGVNGN